MTAPLGVEVASCSRGNLLLHPAVSDHALAMLCSARDLAHVCATSTQHRCALPGLVRTAIKEQHGIGGGSLAELRALENMSSACSVNPKQPGVRTVLHGSDFGIIYVGSIRNMETQAQCPPACGDEWSVAIRLRKGRRYKLSVHGWQNPCHAILELFLDGLRVTPAGFDWSGPRTVNLVCHATGINVRFSGEHHLLGQVVRSNAQPHRRARYWMCIKKIEFVEIEAEKHVMSTDCKP